MVFMPERKNKYCHCFDYYEIVLALQAIHLNFVDCKTIILNSHFFVGSDYVNG